MAPRNLDPRIAAALWIGLIYAAIPIVRRAREAFVAHWPAELIAYAVIAVVLGALAATVISLRRRHVRIDRVDLAWLIGVAAVVVVWTHRLMDQPEEAVHFLEYGVLGVLLYRVLEDRVPDPTVYVAATLAGLLVGTADEIIQWLVPGRFWDFRDIILNGGAVALVQIAVWRLAPRPLRAVSPPSLRFLCRLAAVQMLLLTMCLAATPRRLARLTDHVPLPTRLATGADAICEYGHRHTANDRTVFLSRLSLDELARSDLDRTAEVAAELNASRGADGLSRAAISPVEDPFGYEIRVHLFARNRNLTKALAHQPGSPDHRRHMTTAWRENSILEEFFGSTLQQSSYRWGPGRRREVEAAQDPNWSFVSRAGAHLITRISEGRLRALMLALLALFVACDISSATRSRPESPPVQKNRSRGRTGPGTRGSRAGR